jgi:hypothetical protein
VADRPGHSFEDTIRQHDAAFFSFWEALHVDYGAAGLGIEDNVNSPFAAIDRNDLPILKVFATPQRAVARVVDELVMSGWIAGADAGAQAANAETLREKAGEDFGVLPLPLITVTREEPIPNPQDSGVPKTFRKQCFDEDNAAYQTQRWPGAWEISYRVTAWGIKRATMAFIREWVMSQVGGAGGNEGELFLPVRHEYPWGVINQAMSLDSITDQSQLEGNDDARMLRVEFGFTLKMWHFKRPEPPAGVDPGQPGYADGQIQAIEGFNLEEAVFMPGAAPLGTELDPADFATDATTITQSPLGLNMFSFYLSDRLIPTDWPKAGNALVRRGSRSPLGIEPHPTLRAQVQAPTDEVLISNRTITLDADSLAIITTAFDYKSTGSVEMLLSQKAAGAGMSFSNAYLQEMPLAVGWTHGQFFALVNQPVFSMAVRGTGTAGLETADVSQINMRHIRSPAAKTSPDSTTPGGGETVYQWNSLTAAKTFLAVVTFGTPTGIGTIDVNGEIYTVDPTEQTVGFVGIFSAPFGGGAVTVTVADALNPSVAYMQLYEGFWDGTAI